MPTYLLVEAVGRSCCSPTPVLAPQTKNLRWGRNKVGGRWRQVPECHGPCVGPTSFHVSFWWCSCPSVFANLFHDHVLECGSLGGGGTLLSLIL